MNIAMESREKYANNWDCESTLFAQNGVYRQLSEITPVCKVLEIGSGVGWGTLELAACREVLALDNNSHLIAKARARLSEAGAEAEIIVANVLEPSEEVVQKIAEFGPEVIVGWLLGSSADDQFAYVPADVPLQERAKKYRESIEDAMLSPQICPPSVQWVHLVNRGGLPSNVTEAEACEGSKDDYDTYVFMPNGFEVVDVQILDWNTFGSTFAYIMAQNPAIEGYAQAPKFVSILARRKQR